MDARRQQVYSAFYTWTDGRLCRETDWMAESIETIIEIAEGFEQKVIFLGDGVPVHRERLAENPDFVFAPAHCSQYGRTSVAVLGRILAEEKKTEQNGEFELIYLRKSQAEREREERLSRKGEHEE